MVRENEVWEGVAVESSENHKLDTYNVIYTQSSSFVILSIPRLPDHNNPELVNTFKEWESLRNTHKNFGTHFWPGSWMLKTSAKLIGMVGYFPGQLNSNLAESNGQCEPSRIVIIFLQ
jgi:hypothetical protein